jgi:hypothetical protein
LSRASIGGSHFRRRSFRTCHGRAPLLRPGRDPWHDDLSVLVFWQAAQEVEEEHAIGCNLAQGRGATFVVVMQTAEVGDWDDGAAGWRLGSPRDGSILVQREVRAPLVIPKRNNAIHGTPRSTSLLREVVEGNCVDAFRFALMCAAGIDFQACSFKRSHICPRQFSGPQRLDGRHGRGPTQKGSSVRNATVQETGACRKRTIVVLYLFCT